MHENVSVAYGDATSFVKRLKEKRPLFVCIIGTSETAKIPGISAAGKNSEFTDYTPPADVEFLLLGKCECIASVPVTPEGIPTPALITRAAIKLAKISVLVVNGGSRIKPCIPFLDVGGSPGRDIRSGRAVDDPERIFHRAKVLGKELAKLSDYLVVGESIPGGTTTALAVLTAMGIEAEGKVSSSMPHNPHSIKVSIVREALRNSGLAFGSLSNDPFRAIAKVGDPVMAAFSGLVVGAAKSVPVLMAGGTQMCAILAIIKAVDPKLIDNVSIGTTKWIVLDAKSDIKGIVRQIAEVPILVAELDFKKSRFSGLRAYEDGAVKEGVGAGGATIAAMIKEGLTSDTILKEVERSYEQITLMRKFDGKAC